MAEDWQAIAKAINDRMADLPMSQRDLADRSGVSVATIREIQRGDTSRRRSTRTLEAISEALDWPGDYLQAVLAGKALPTGGPSATKSSGELTLVLSRLDQLHGEVRRLAEAVERLSDGGGTPRER